MVPPRFRESDYEMLEKPYGVLYQPQPDGTFKELWKVKGWYSHEVYLTYDAKYLVRMGPWQTGIGPTKHHLAVAFYAEGKLLKKFSVARLIKDDSKVSRSTSHYDWRLDGDGFPYLSPGGYLFRVRTVENRVFNFSVTDGNLISVEEYKPEQDGAGQPATRSESNLEGSDKPQPEAEGRSRLRVPGLDVAQWNEPRVPEPEELSKYPSSRRSHLTETWGVRPLS